MIIASKKPPVREQTLGLENGGPPVSGEHLNYLDAFAPHREQRRPLTATAVMCRRRVFGLNSVSALLLGAWLAGLALRLFGAAGQLTLDEVWSLDLTAGAHSALNLFGITEDNNHLLQSLFFYVLGPQQPFFVYRALSLAAGILAPLIIINRKKNSSTNWPAAAAVLLGPLFVSISCVGRGYAPLILFSLIGLRALERFLHSNSTAGWLLFQLSVVLGLLSQSMFAIFYAAVLCSSAVHLYSRMEHAEARRTFVKLHLLPLLFFTAWMVLFIAPLQLRGGEPVNYISALLAAYETPLGGGGSIPAGDWTRALPDLLIALLAASIALNEITRCAKTNPAEAVFFIVAIFAAPLAFLLITRPSVTAGRHFIIASLAATLLLGRTTTRWLAGSKRQRVIGLLVCFIFFLNSVPRLVDFSIYRHGDYAGAVTFVARHAPDQRTTVGAENDFRVQKLLGFYWPRLTQQVALELVKRSEWTKTSPDWVIIDRAAQQKPPRIMWRTPNGAVYRLAQVFPASQLLGCSWYLFRKQDIDHQHAQ